MAHVAVDPETGVVRMVKYVAVQDMGTIINRKAASTRAGELREFARQLAASRAKASRSYAEMAAVVEERDWMGEKALLDYWQRVSYDLDPLHVEGLRCFYLLLEKHSLIEKAPELEFCA